MVLDLPANKEATDDCLPVSFTDYLPLLPFVRSILLDLFNLPLHLLCIVAGGKVQVQLHFQFSLIIKTHFFNLLQLRGILFTW